MEGLQRHDPTDIAGARVLGRLGEGGMGIVYLAEPPDGRRVAVKVIRPEFAHDPAFRARFAREVAASQRVDGRCTARVLAADITATPPYLVTEFIDGPNLAEYIATSGPFDGAALHALAAGLAEALVAIHAAGVIHRDLKPTNVLLTLAGPKVVDFGVASAPDSTALTTAHTRLGSPGWMAPEQVSGDPVGPAADIFGWGLVVAYASNGHHPFGAGPAEALLYRVMNEQPRLDHVPASLRPLVARGLSREPAARPTATELLALLLGGAVPDPASAVTVLLARTWRPALVPTRALGTPAAPQRRRRRTLTAAAVVLIAGAAALGWLWLKPGGDSGAQVAAGASHKPEVATTSTTATSAARRAAAPPTPTRATTARALVAGPASHTSVSATPVQTPTLGTGLYADGPQGTPHYYVLLRRGADLSVSGTLAYLYQDGTSGNLRTFTGPAEQAGAITITFNDGTLDLINDIGDGQAFEISGCLGYLSEAKTRPDCTFSVHPQAQSPVTAATSTSTGPATAGYRTYANPRFGFSTQVPINFNPGPEPENGGGMKFTSHDGRATVTAYGSNNSFSDTVPSLEDKIAADLQGRGGTVTYRNKSASIAAVSGTYPSSLGAMVFYERSVVGIGSIDTVMWTYPVADKHADDPLLYKSVGTFRPGDLTQGH